MDTDLITTHMVLVVDGLTATGHFIDDAAGLVATALDYLINEHTPGTPEYEWIVHNELPISEMLADYVRETR